VWSLSVEEQFYLLWPVVVLFSGQRNLLRVCLCIIVVVPVIRAATWFAFSQNETAMTREFQVVADTLASGALLACLVRSNMMSSPYLAFVRSNAALAVGALTLLVSFGSFVLAPGLFYVPMQSFANLSMVLVLHHAMTTPKGWFGRFLNLKPMVYIGTISYSMYLWQEIFLDAYLDRWYTRFPQNVLLTLIAAVASFYIIERPFLGLRRRFRRVGG
jgi:peptidoglycan/LPS O-acetylase OafA/YrhL